MSMSNRADFIKQLSDLEKLSHYADGLHNLRKAVFQKEKNIDSAHVIDDYNERTDKYKVVLSIKHET